MNVILLIKLFLTLARISRATDFFEVYRELHEVETYLIHNSNLTISEYQTQSRVIGTTVERRKVRTFAIESMTKKKKILLIISGAHGREWISISSTLYFLDSVIACLKQSFRMQSCAETELLLAKYDLHFIPILNPDGYAYTWLSEDMPSNLTRLRLKKGSHTGVSKPRPAPASRFWRGNRKRIGKVFKQKANENFGVDLNRNWGTEGINWGLGVKQVSSKNFQGHFGFSEHETNAVREYVKQIKGINVFLDIHCCSRNVIAPFSLVPYGNETAKLVAEKGVMISNAMQNIRGHNVAKLAVSNLTDAKKASFLSIFKKKYFYKTRPVTRGKFTSGLSTGWAFTELKVMNSFTIEVGAKFITPSLLIKPIGKELTAGIVQIARFDNDQAQDVKNLSHTMQFQDITRVNRMQTTMLRTSMWIFSVFIFVLVGQVLLLNNAHSLQHRIAILLTVVTLLQTILFLK